MLWKLNNWNIFGVPKYELVLAAHEHVNKGRLCPIHRFCLIAVLHH